MQSFGDAFYRKMVKRSGTINTMRTAVLLYLSIGSFFAGVAIESFTNVSVPTLMFTAFLAGALLFYHYRTRSKTTFAVILVLTFLVLGVGRLSYAEHHIRDVQTAFEIYEEDQTLTGVVIGEVVGKDTSQRFVVEAGEAHVTVTAGRFPKVLYGDVVTLEGVVTLPEAFETEAGRLFDYPRFLAARGVTHQMFYPIVEVTGEHGGSSIKRGLFTLKNAFLARIRAIIPEPHAALLGGLIVGTQEAMGENLLDAFRITGLIHIVVLSGYNITIVAESIMRFFGFLPRRAGIVLGAVSIILFAVLTGGTPTIVRASIMALLVLAARLTGRTYEIVRALFITALFMVFYNPHVLLFDPSFQLSFLATLGLIYFVPLLERVTVWMSRFPTVQSFVLATVATQLFVLPLLLYQVGTLSVVSVLVNVLVLPVMPTVMFFGVLTGAASFLHPLAGIPFGFLSYLILEYILSLVLLFSEIPFAAVHLEHFPLWLMMTLYLCYTIFLIHYQVYTKKVEAT